MVALNAIVIQLAGNAVGVPFNAMKTVRQTAPGNLLNWGGFRMCGIVGYIGSRNAIDYLLEGLRRLEYRGYDSAGVATLNGTANVHTVKTVGRIENLAKRSGAAQSAWQDRYRPHALGNARRCDPGKRTSALWRQRSPRWRWCITE